jgi:hypothetical protein
MHSVRVLPRRCAAASGLAPEIEGSNDMVRAA